MKPIIVVSPSDTHDQFSHRPLWLVKRSYALAISGAGGSPVLATEPRFFKDYAAMADGLLLTDGVERINPGRYLERMVPGKAPADLSQTRDSMDIPLCRAFIEAGKPVFGIGRGMQVINVVLGGKLYQDLAAECEKTHPVNAEHTISASGKLAELIGAKATVNSYHYGAVKTLGEGLEAVATSDDGVIEAIWHKSLPVFGVQWNPETYCTDDAAWYEKLQAKEPFPKATKEQIDTMKSIGFRLRKPIPGSPTDLDAVRPTDNALFNHFISLCAKEG